MQVTSASLSQSPVRCACLQRNVLKPGGALEFLTLPQLVVLNAPTGLGPQAPSLEKPMQVCGWEWLQWLPGDPQVPLTLILPA